MGRQAWFLNWFWSSFFISMLKKRPTNISKYVLYNKGIISISEYHHPSCEECRQERKSIDVNHTSQLEAFIYFSGSGSGLRIPVPDPAFLVFHTPLRAQSRGRRSIYFKLNWTDHFYGSLFKIIVNYSVFLYI